MTSRCRTSNFSLKERCIFIELLVKNYPFLHEDKGHSKSNNDIRSTAWNDLTKDFHVILADKNVYRTTKQLKTLYENIKHKIKRNIGQGFMQADVKTAKDIPLSLFMELKSQYEGEMGKGGVDGFGYATAHGEGSGPPMEVKSCGHATGRQGCGVGCKCRSYSNGVSSKKSSGGGASPSGGHKVEKWMNSRQEEIIVLDSKTIIFNDCRQTKCPRKSHVISNLPPNVGVRYPTNLSKNIYELSESSEEEEDEAEEDEEETASGIGGEGSNHGNEDHQIGHCGNRHANSCGERYSLGNHGNGFVNNGDAYGAHGYQSSRGTRDVTGDEHDHATNHVDGGEFTIPGNMEVLGEYRNGRDSGENCPDRIGELADGFEADETGSTGDETRTGEFGTGEDYESDQLMVDESDMANNFKQVINV